MKNGILKNNRTEKIGPDEILHPWMLQSEPPTATIVGGRGCYVEDSTGKEYLDFMSAMYTANLGHRNTEVISSMSKQLRETGTFSSEFAYPSRSLLAKKLIKMLPSKYEKVSFQSNGTDALEAAIMMARQVTGRNGIVSQLLSYHGSSSETFTSADWPTNSHPPNVAGYVYCFPPYHYRCPFCKTKKSCDLDCAKSLGELIEWSGPERIAAVVIEPILGSVVNELAIDYMKILAEICRKHDILLIADEVLTGFGRTGKMFGFEHAGIEPDIIAVGKGLTSGYAPLSATIVNHRISEFYKNRTFEFGFTLGGHPVACSAALATIDYYEKHDILQRVRHIGSYLHKELEALKERQQCIAEVRGAGLLFGIEYGDGAIDPHHVKQEAFERGLIVDKGIFAINMLAPPFIVEKKEIDHAVDVLEQALTPASSRKPH
jgi:taurine---2-oxoglutarate transaminase